MTQKNDNIQQCTIQPRVLWMKDPVRSPNSPDWCDLAGFRIVSDGKTVIVERAGEFNAVGDPRWCLSSFSRLPSDGIAYIARALLNHPDQSAPAVFTHEVSEFTPDIVKQFVGQPVALAATVFANALQCHEQNMSQLRDAIDCSSTNWRSEGKNVVAAAVSVIDNLLDSNNQLSINYDAANEKLETLLDGASDLIVEILKVQFAAVENGQHVPALNAKSMCRAATDVIKYLAATAVATTVETVTTTIVNQMPLFPSS